MNVKNIYLCIYIAFLSVFIINESYPIKHNLCEKNEKNF